MADGGETAAHVVVRLVETEVVVVIVVSVCVVPVDTVVVVVVPYLFGLLEPLLWCWC